MKKYLILILSIFLLVACSDKNETKNENDEVNNKNNETSSQSEEQVENEKQQDEKEDKESLEDDSNVEDTVTNNDDLEKFPEFDTIAEYIELDTYQGLVETDNKGNRIIIFKDENGNSEYKSIFVKNDNRLKIVKFKDDGLLYNEIIK
ncbi:MAG TPA: hypothetical protein VK068_00160 [Jeotgalicoccus sp.]|nr:hypothetical protein [Jeotgalicoccus sp.]